MSKLQIFTNALARGGRHGLDLAPGARGEHAWYLAILVVTMPHQHTTGLTIAKVMAVRERFQSRLSHAYDTFLAD
jgi:hypothetical protein